MFARRIFLSVAAATLLMTGLVYEVGHLHHQAHHAEHHADGDTQVPDTCRLYHGGMMAGVAIELPPAAILSPEPVSSPSPAAPRATEPGYNPPRAPPVDRNA